MTDLVEQLRAELDERELLAIEMVERLMDGSHGIDIDAFRCAALVARSPDALRLHEGWHERIEAVLASVEHSDALAAELRERGEA